MPGADRASAVHGSGISCPSDPSPALPHVPDTPTRMAVFTEVSFEEAAHVLGQLGLGQAQGLAALSDVAGEGVFRFHLDLPKSGHGDERI